jgi:predicted TIM-barrel fold metal-dependent hydrolase
MPVVDIHQHLWPGPLLEALASRTRPPRLRGTTLELAGEGSTTVDPRDHDLGARLELLDRCGIELAVVSLQPTLGVGKLPEDEREELVTAYEEGMRDLAAVSPRLLPLGAGRCVPEFPGACVGADELLDLARLAATLDELERSGKLLFVHPGPGERPAAGFPDWWPAVVDYTAQMQAAYAAWIAVGVERWPDLDVVFALLAGGAPFQLERMQSRGVRGRELLHPRIHFETSSYGRRALELCLATFGVDRLLFGSDTPVLDPEQALTAIRSFGDAVTDALCAQNPLRVLS